MPLTDPFLNLSGYDRPLEPIVAMQTKTGTFRVPDTHWTPDIFVYFDFVRAVTTDPNTNGQIPDLNTTFGSIKAKERVEYYYELFADFERVFGVDLDIGAFRANGNTPSSLEEKQDHLNLLIRNFITAVTVQRTSTGPGTANVTISFPTFDARNRGGPSTARVFDNLLFWNHFFTPDTSQFTVLDQLITPHTWIYIYGRGRTDPDNFYPIFTGFVNRVTHSGSSGFTGLKVTCEDTLKLAHKSQIRLNPSFADVAGEALKGAMSENFVFFSNPLAGLSMDQIVAFLLTGSKDTSAPLSSTGIHDYKFLFNPNSPNASDFSTYAKSRLIKTQEMEAMPSAIRTNRRGKGSKVILWGLEITPYRTLFPMKTPSFFTSVFINRMETMREVARRGMFEFYADAYGSYVIHPYRLSAPWLTNVGSVGTTMIADPSTSGHIISSDELITYDFTLSDEEMITALAFQGQTPLVAGTDLIDFLSKRVPAISKDLVGRYGVWYAEHNEPLVNIGNDETGGGDATGTMSPELQLFAYARLSYNNRDVYSAQVSVPFRPELDVARPVYFPDRRDIGYIVSIDHNFSVGSSATTGISVSFARKVDSLPIDFTEFLVQSGGIVPQGTLNAAEVRVLLSLFEAASGFNRLDPNIAFSVGSPTSLQSNPTTNKFIEIALAAQPAGKTDKSIFLRDIIEQFGRERFTRGG